MGLLHKNLIPQLVFIKKNIFRIHKQNRLLIHSYQFHFFFSISWSIKSKEALWSMAIKADVLPFSACSINSSYIFIKAVAGEWPAWLPWWWWEIMLLVWRCCAIWMKTTFSITFASLCMNLGLVGLGCSCLFVLNLYHNIR